MQHWHHVKGPYVPCMYVYILFSVACLVSYFNLCFHKCTIGWVSFASLSVSYVYLQRLHIIFLALVCHGLFYLIILPYNLFLYRSLLYAIVYPFFFNTVSVSLYSDVIRGFSNQFSPTYEIQNIEICRKLFNPIINRKFVTLTVKRPTFV